MDQCALIKKDELHTLHNRLQKHMKYDPTYIKGYICMCTCMCVHACLCMMGTREMEWEGERLERDRDIRKTVTEKFIALAVEFLMLLPLPLCFNVLSEYSTYYL